MLRRAAVLCASVVAFVAACGRSTRESARGQLGAAQLHGAGALGADAPNDQVDAVLAPAVWGSGGAGGGIGGGEGGAPELAEGEAGAGGAPVGTCERLANVVPPTCPTGGPPGAYRETGLGFLGITGWQADARPLTAMSSARAINSRGDVVGYASLCEMTRAILYRGGSLLELDPIPEARTTFALDINDEGDVLVESDGVIFVWKDGVTTVLSGIERGSGIAINNLGQVLGTDDEGAFIWDAGVVMRLGLDPNTRVTDLNDRGQVTGYYAYEARPAFVWEGGALTALPPLPGHGYAVAFAINEAGQVVGSSFPHAVLWDSGVPFDITPPTDYPLMDSAGFDINESGVVLGHFQEDGPRQNSAAFVFDHGVMTLIFPEDPTVGASLSPSAINDHGEIAGTSILDTGAPHQATVWSRACFGACCQ